MWVALIGQYNGWKLLSIYRLFHVEHHNAFVYLVSVWIVSRETVEKSDLLSRFCVSRETSE